jgi:Flp pilus assembly protein TadG
LHSGLIRRQSSGRESGQALLEFALVALILIAMVFGIIDFSRAIYQKQVISHLTREGSNLASRSTSTTPLSDAALAVVNGATPLNLNTNGYVIVSSVENNNGTCQITDQVAMGGNSAGSKIGTKGSTSPTLPQPCSNNGTGLPQKGQTMYVTEVFYTYQPVTPVGSILNIVMPSQLYDVAYF